MPDIDVDRMIEDMGLGEASISNGLYPVLGMTMYAMMRKLSTGRSATIRVEGSVYRVTLEEIG